MTPEHPPKISNVKRSSTAPNKTLYALLIGGLSYAGGIALDGAIAQAADNAPAVPSAQDLLAPVIKADPLPPAPAPIPSPNVVAPAAPTPIAPAPPVIINSPTIEFSQPEAPSVPVAPVAPAPTLPSSIDLSEVEADVPTITIDNGSGYVDTTDYGIGATPSPNMVPNIIITERSTGCKTVLLQGQGVPANACGYTNPSGSATVATGQRLSSHRLGQSLIPLPQINEVTIGPLSIGANGVQITRRLSVQDYYNRTERPKSLAGNENTNMLFPLSVPAMISSPFGLRVHPIFGDTRMHTGTDLAASMGTPVVAAYSGRVAVSDFMGGYGLTVVIGHSEKSAETLYGHLSEVFVKAGEWVEQGEIIGRVGSTGNSTGPHLHFELRKQTANGWVAVNSGDILQNGLAKIHEGFELGEGFSIADTNWIDPVSGEVIKLSVPNVLQQGKNATKDGIGDNAIASEVDSSEVDSIDNLASETPASNEALANERPRDGQVSKSDPAPGDLLPQDDNPQPGDWVLPKELVAEDQ
ncbi:MAG: M23 family metallopeptidase [Merismopedia sp. SIO2A8]|nr:M23 family metallopeptidase [Merismopedia sp. SIO2A8]